jgi:hypothetical protein
VIVEARALKALNNSGPGDVVALDFFAEGRHLLFDAFFTSVYRNSILSRASTILGYAVTNKQ